MVLKLPRRDRSSVNTTPHFNPIDRATYLPIHVLLGQNGIRDQVRIDRLVRVQRHLHNYPVHPRIIIQLVDLRLVSVKLIDDDASCIVMSQQLNPLILAILNHILDRCVYSP